MVEDTRGPRSYGRGQGPSRRTLLKGAGAAAFGIGSLAVLPLFDTPSAKQNPADCKSTDLSASQKKLIVSNWPEYIDVDPEKGATTTLQDFERRTGIKVDYTDDVSDNAEFFAKVRNQLSYCEPIGRDMMMLTDWMAARMIGLGWIQPLDPAKVQNLHKNLIKPLQGRQWDKDRTYSAPWQSGLTGIAYNSKKTKEVRSFEELLTRPDLKGKITLLSEMRDTMAFMLKIEGADPDKFTPDEWANAIDNLRGVVKAGQVRAFTGNEYIQDLAAGNIVACEAWSGDVISAQADSPDIKFVVPEEGLSLWSDNMIVPNKADHLGERREVDRLLLRARGGGEAGRVGQLHLPGRGRPRGDGEDRRLPRRQPADLPLREGPREHVRLHGPRRCRSPTVRRRVFRCHRWLKPAPRPAPRRTKGLQLRSLTKEFAAFTAVRSLDLDIPTGSFFALLGPSGCGKTTTLRMVAGLETPTSGTITLGGKDITWQKPYRRPVNTVFQNYALFPHLDIYENVAFGLRRRRSKEVEPKVREMLDLVELESQARKKPAQLSGGQQQRVALARALINSPEVLLLDEPLGALDLKLRRSMQIELKRIQTEVGLTFVHVTHDQEEAMTMADTIAVMNQRRDRADGCTGRAVRQPADDVRRQLPRSVEPDRGDGARQGGRLHDRRHPRHARLHPDRPGARQRQGRRPGLARDPAREGPDRRGRREHRRARQQHLRRHWSVTSASSA